MSIKASETETTKAISLKSHEKKYPISFDDISVKNQWSGELF